MHKKEKEQEFKARLADCAVKVKTWTKLQAKRPEIECEGRKLQNVFKFKYLGTLLFVADGRDDYDIKARITKAQLRCRQLRNMLHSDHLSVQINVRLYIAAVGSLMTYGAETWDLNAKTRRKLNGANSLMLASFTGKSIREEARPESTSYNLVHHIRVRRFRWLGHILREGQGRLVYEAVKLQRENGKEGNLLMDAPPHQSLYHLQLIAEDKTYWRSLERNIGTSGGPALRQRSASHKPKNATAIVRSEAVHSIEDAIATRSADEDAARKAARTCSGNADPRETPS